MKLSIVLASLLAFAPLAYADFGDKFIECTVTVSGQELIGDVILDQKSIQLIAKPDNTWVGSAELQIDPTKKHLFTLRRTENPGIDLITKISNGMEFGFFGIEHVEISFDQNDYSTRIVCTEKI